MADLKCNSFAVETNNIATTKINLYYKWTNKTDLQRKIPTHIVYKQKLRSKVFPYTKILRMKSLMYKTTYL